jgi:hypothetical protein
VIFQSVALFITPHLRIFSSVPPPFFISSFILYKKAIGFCSKCARKKWQGLSILPSVVQVPWVRFYSFLLVVLCIKETTFCPFTEIFEGLFLSEKKTFSLSDVTLA